MSERLDLLKIARRGQIHKTSQLCDHCNGDDVVYNCPVCGAPVCCPTCCEEALEELISEATNED